MRFLPTAAALALTLALGPTGLAWQPARTDAPAAAPTSADLAKIADGLAASCVRVEYTIQYDKGDSPGSDYSSWARGASRQDSGTNPGNWEQYVKDERPAEFAGYVLSPTRVISTDVLLHPRFIKEINIRAGDQLVKARVASVSENSAGVVLELAEPLKSAKALAFDASKPGPFLTAAYREREGDWAVAVGGGPTRVSVERGKRSIMQSSAEAIVLARDGTPVGISMNGDLPLDDSWKGSPDGWAWAGADEVARLLAALEKSSGNCVLRVTLNLRSPRGGGSERFSRYRRGSGDEDGEMTEWNGSGILIDDTTVVVLAGLKPKLTGRLEGIKVFSPDGTAANAKFAGTLRDYGCLLATLEHPLSGAARFAGKPVAEQRDKMILMAEVSVLGEIRTAYYCRERIGAYNVGWKRQIYPAVSPGRSSGRGRFSSDSSNGLNFLFAADGELIAAPIARRQKVAVEQDYSYGSSDSGMMPVEYLAEVLKNRGAAIDPENRPLTEQEENRLAWLGVEMQPMDPDLARANNVVDQTAEGTTGAMVTFLYPDSPASKAGLQVGDILLRLHVQGQPKPLDVQLEGSGMEEGFDQMWAMLDQIPGEYFDQMPKPWGNAENSLTRALTDIGFGTPFSAEIFRDGKLISKSFTVEQGPAYYESATRFKSEPAGITVRDLTYEVRRYFHLKTADPGVIISKIEKGGKAAVAGLKPMEIILSVDDKPVNAVGDFEKAIAAGGEFRLSVKRMTEGRIVKFKVPAKADAKPEEKPEDKKEGAKPDKEPPK